MMRIKSLIVLLIAAAFVLPQSADAQLLKRLKERAQERIQKNVEEEAADAATGAIERKMSESEELNLGPNASGPANAPYLRYTNTTSVDLGALGKVASLFGQKLNKIQETVALSGDYQRSDTETNSTIIDLENDRFITLDHERKTYTIMTFEQMVEHMEQAMAQAQEGMAEAQAEEAATADDDDVEGDVQFDVKVEKTGKRESVNGTPAEQVLLTIRADFEVKGTDDEGNTEEAKGTAYALVDSWTTKALAGSATLEAFQRRMGEKMGAEMRDSNLGTSLSAMGLDPRMSGLMTEAGRELEKLEGAVVRSTMHLILVPEGQELDVQAALDGTTDENAQQATLAKITTQISDLKLEPIPASL
ncbi:MAG TPA: hypothetical protein VF190_14200, partial [Rhodothermales bacterium]